MNITALLAWYEEEPAWLAATVASLARCNISHLVAVDGAYLLFPNGRNTSDPYQHHAILEACHAAGIGHTIHVPQDRWANNEIEKRTRMFALGEQTNADWYLVIDADEIVTHPIDLQAELATTNLDVAEVTLWEHHDRRDEPSRQAMPRETGQAFRCLFRAIPGLHVADNHYTYKTPDGRYLWGQPSQQVTLEPALDLTHLRVQHRTALRASERSREQYAYYKLRRELNTETHTCDRCGQPATRHLATNFTLHPDGHLEAGHTTVCDTHVPDVEADNQALLNTLGVDITNYQPHMYQPA